MAADPAMRAQLEQAMKDPAVQVCVYLCGVGRCAGVRGREEGEHTHNSRPPDPRPALLDPHPPRLPLLSLLLTGARHGGEGDVEDQAHQVPAPGVDGELLLRERVDEEGWMERVGATARLSQALSLSLSLSSFLTVCSMAGCRYSPTSEVTRSRPRKAAASVTGKEERGWGWKWRGLGGGVRARGVSIEFGGGEGAAGERAPSAGLWRHRSRTSALRHQRTQRPAGRPLHQVGVRDTGLAKGGDAATHCDTTRHAAKKWRGGPGVTQF